MKRIQSACLVPLLVFASLAATGAPAPAQDTGAGDAKAADAKAVVMASHHATYKLTLLTAKGSNPLASASGVIDYDFGGSDCAGYTTVFRQVTEMQPAEGDSKLSDTRSTTFEDGPGKVFTFESKTSMDDDTVGDIAGRAERGADGSVSVDVKRPAGTATFGAGVLFPTEHLRRVIAAAERGEKLLSAEVFDGSDTGRKLYNTLTVIGAPITAPPDDAAGKAEATKSMRRWPVVISYFENGKDDQPDYVLSSDLYEDGISRALKLDYGDFTLAGALQDLTVRPQAACTPK